MQLELTYSIVRHYLYTVEIVPSTEWIKVMKLKEICSCGICLNSYCSSSDSKLTIKECWCAECKDTRKEIKLNAYAITIVKGSK